MNNFNSEAIDSSNLDTQREAEAGLNDALTEATSDAQDVKDQITDILNAANLETKGQISRLLAARTATVSDYNIDFRTTIQTPLSDVFDKVDTFQKTLNGRPVETLKSDVADDALSDSSYNQGRESGPDISKNRAETINDSISGLGIEDSEAKLDDIATRLDTIDRVSSNFPNFDDSLPIDEDLRTYFSAQFQTLTEAFLGKSNSSESIEPPTPQEYQNNVAALIRYINSIRTNSQTYLSAPFADLPEFSITADQFRQQQIASLREITDNQNNPYPTNGKISEAFTKLTSNRNIVAQNLTTLKTYKNKIDEYVQKLRDKYPSGTKPARVEQLLTFGASVQRDINNKATENLNKISSGLLKTLIQNPATPIATATTATFEEYFDAQATSSTLNPKPTLNDFESPFKNLGELRIDADRTAPANLAANDHFKLSARINLRNAEGEVTGQLRRGTEIVVLDPAPVFSTEQGGKTYDFIKIAKADNPTTEVGCVCSAYFNAITPPAARGARRSGDA